MSSFGEVTPGVLAMMVALASPSPAVAEISSAGHLEPSDALHAPEPEPEAAPALRDASSQVGEGLGVSFALLGGPGFGEMSDVPLWRLYGRVLYGLRLKHEQFGLGVGIEASFNSRTDLFFTSMFRSTLVEVVPMARLTFELDLPITLYSFLGLGWAGSRTSTDVMFEGTLSVSLSGSVYRFGIGAELDPARYVDLRKIPIILIVEPLSIHGYSFRLEHGGRVTGTSTALLLGAAYKF